MTATYKQIVVPITIFILGYIAEYTMNLVMARFLGVVAYGDFSVAFYMVRLTAIVILLGNYLSAIKFIPAYVQRKHWGLIKGFLYYHSRILLMMSLFVLALITLYYVFSFFSIHHYLKLPTLDRPVFLMLLFAPLLAINIFISSLLASFKQPTWSSITARLMFPVFLLMGLILWSYLFDGIALINALMLLGMSLIVTVALQFYILFQSMPRIINSTKAEFASNDWSNALMPLFISSLLFTISNQINLYMLEILHPTEHAVGYFATILVIISVLWLPRHGAALVYNQNIGALVATEDWPALQRLAKQAARKLTLIMLFILGIIAIFATHILAMFGKGFVTVEWPLILTAMGCSIRSMFLFADPILKYAGFHRKNVFPQAMTLSLNIILNIILVPIYGVLGVAWSLFISRFTLVIWQWYLAKKLLNINVFCL